MLEHGQGAEGENVEGNDEWTKSDLQDHVDGSVLEV